MVYSKRLQAALNWINEDDILADIGCDHGYLGIMALNKGIKHVLLIDNKIGPIKQASKNLLEEGFNEGYELICSSGLKDVKDHVTCIAILGMGGDLISNIIDESIDKIDETKKLILCAHSKIEHLRAYLNEHNLHIVEEIIVNENGKYYELMKVIKKSFSQNLTSLEIKMGPCLLKTKSPEFIDKWRYIHQKYQNIIDESDKKLDNMEQELKIIGEVLWPK